MSDSFTFHRTARSWRAGLVVAGVWAACIWAYFAIEASPVLMGLLCGFTLPAIWDLIRNPASGLCLTDKQLTWHSGHTDAELALAELDHMRFDTRLDMSVRVTAILRFGRRIRIPFEATPPHDAFERALQDRGVKTERHHFVFWQ